MARVLGKPLRGPGRPGLTSIQLNPSPGVSEDTLGVTSNVPEKDNPLSCSKSDYRPAQVSPPGTAFVFPREGHVKGS